ncbi:hypothetical protein V8G54_008639 [Vigna mungo]|uniref:Pentatricopeptide repeat-containing protein n=1 Tax=Vigna mungo TaxID=3915 RepID=A0AAQ3S8E4_VIGMU
MVIKYMELWDHRPKFDGNKMPDYTTMVCQCVLHKDNVHRSRLLKKCGMDRINWPIKCALLAILPSFFDVDMVNTLFSIFLAKGKLSLACKLFEIFSDAGVSPGYFIEASAVVAEMGEKFCSTDIATYNMIL